MRRTQLGRYARLALFLSFFLRCKTNTIILYTRKIFERSEETIETKTKQKYVGNRLKKIFAELVSVESV